METPPVLEIVGWVLMSSTILYLLVGPTVEKKFKPDSLQKPFTDLMLIEMVVRERLDQMWLNKRVRGYITESEVRYFLAELKETFSEFVFVIDFTPQSVSVRYIHITTPDCKGDLVLKAD